MQAQTSIFSHIQESTTALEQGLVHEILSGMQFLPQQRVLLWCGGLRPSDLLCWARIAVRTRAAAVAHMRTCQSCMML